MSRSLLDVLCEYTAKGNLVRVLHLASIPAIQFTMERAIGPEEQVYRAQVCISLIDLASSRNPEGMMEQYFKDMDRKIKDAEESL